MSITTIGGLRDALAKFPSDLPIFIDKRHPTALSSYRGFYNDLAIERSGNNITQDETVLDERPEPLDLPFSGHYWPGCAEVRIKQPATVGELVKALNLAIGATFEGYKGGQYTMHAGTDLWVSEYGHVDDLRIVSILEAAPDHIDLRTEEQRWTS